VHVLHRVGLVAIVLLTTAGAEQLHDVSTVFRLLGKNDRIAITACLPCIHVL